MKIIVSEMTSATMATMIIKSGAFVGALIALYLKKRHSVYQPGSRFSVILRAAVEQSTGDEAWVYQPVP